jgi:hypothetical protein
MIQRKPGHLGYEKLTMTMMMGRVSVWSHCQCSTCLCAHYYRLGGVERILEFWRYEYLGCHSDFFGR